jgi:hypothetical protein
MTLPPEIISAALTMYLDGYSPCEISFALKNISPTTISRHIIAAKINRSSSEARRLFYLRKNGRLGHVNSDGYVTIEVNGVTSKEHRLMMEAFLGRPLSRDEYVHHKDGDRSNNILKNLELWVARRSPPGQRVTDRVQDALEILARYSGEFL